MPSVDIFDLNNAAVGSIELSDAVFGAEVNEALLYEAVRQYTAAKRSGTAATKTRHEVSGSGKKLWKQKGTGRARQGSTRAPQFRHGGVVWGPKPHPYHHDVPRKMRRLAIRSALSDKVANEQLIVVNNLALDAPRTKDMLTILDKLPVNGKRVLMMLPKRDENILLSVRNIPMAKAQHVSSINVVELLKHDFVIMPKQTVRWIELVFGEGVSAEEASKRIADEFGEQEAAPQHTEDSMVSPQISDSHEAEAEISSEVTEDEQTALESDSEASATTDGEEG